MTRHSLGAALAASWLLLPAAPAFGQNSSDPATTTPPPTTTERPPAPTPPPAPSAPEPVRTETPAPRSAPEVVAVPVPVQSAPPATIELQDQPYPNGFADPNAAFGNDLSVQVREQDDGFDWGLLGLLGLLGLFGLRRPREGHRHVVHSERYDDGRPPRV